MKTDLISALTGWDTGQHRWAVRELRVADAPVVRAFAKTIAAYLDDEQQRTKAVWATSTLVRLWYEQVACDLVEGTPLSALAWPVIIEIRRTCLPTLFDLREWFGWSPWDDCLVLAPLCAVEVDQYFLVGMQIVEGVGERHASVHSEARHLARTLFRVPTPAELDPYRTLMGETQLERT